eukprot:TRINITY_DN75_c0_g1_i2.p1 TRINITY_DN75_c0_g1~~TRINITY_DN75_c0_g1_i2.p1  ORF type:complete len:675 (+),score=160.52 TRINITY_DN75_c0_g1_i2:146-2170(+)
MKEDGWTKEEDSSDGIGNGNNNNHSSNQNTNDKFSLIAPAIQLSVKDASVDFIPSSMASIPFIGSGGKTKKKRLLQPISFTIQSGEMLSILGGSGSGKTTLLNTVAGRLESSLEMQGQVLLNGKNASQKVIRKSVGYVMQQDHLLPNLTVRETLQYAALLRLPDSISKAKKMELVEEAIAELGLRDCAETYIGGNGRRGVSGGEKRRVSIGVQILTNPSILLLDEPTSGLDSFTAHMIMETLLSLAVRQNRTVICTIHQPRSDIFQLFDKMMILARGNLVYFGSKAATSSYFKNIGIDCPRHANPADFYLDATSVDYRSVESEEISNKKMLQCVEEFKKAPKDESGGVFVPGEEKSSTMGPKKLIISTDETNESKHSETGDLREGVTEQAGQASFVKATVILTRRAYVNFFRHSSASIRVAQTLALAVLLCLCFWRLKNDQYSIQNRIGILYQVLGLTFVGVLNSVAIFPTERNVFYQERADGLYSTPAFFISYQAVELPLNFFGTFFFSILAYWVLGLYANAGHFFLFVFVSFILLVSGETVGIGMCAIFYDVGMATTVASVFMSIFNIIAGLFRPNDTLFWPLRAINYVLVPRWAATVLGINEFVGKTFECPGEQSQGLPVCPIPNGESLLNLYNISENQLGYAIALLVILTLSYRIIVFLLLHFKKTTFST